MGLLSVPKKSYVKTVSRIWFKSIKHKKYKYSLLETVIVNLNTPLFGTLPKKIENDYYKIEKEKITIKTGYAWNGCDVVPDYKFIKASLVHDVLCQALREGQLTADPYAEIAHIIFYEVGILTNSHLRKEELSFVKKVALVYYLGVKYMYKWYTKIF